MIEGRLWQIKNELGILDILCSDKRLFYLGFNVNSKRKQNAEQIEKIAKTQKLTIKKDKNSTVESVEHQLKKYINKEIKTINVNFLIEESDFINQTLKKTLEVQFGSTTSYKSIAINIEHPKAHRAVANALGANKICILIPCHRIIKSNGEIGGYAGGSEIKKYLLDLEKANNC